MSGQLHAPASLPPGIETPVHTGKEAAWAPGAMEKSKISEPREDIYKKLFYFKNILRKELLR
jgi:hypothetical protein